ncbi:helix-turn-helix transcriptional regulator [Bacillus testis]|uniref:helix-turn-helix transcriptional regulator n=1 Tax=Bacillus testis TaxID=1622072 RepID=UPI00067F283D|nr:helix-turn-helix transcriptional regulator [Bacillus testis]
MSIMNHIKEIRAKHQWTQSDLANAVNVSRQTIVALEKGSYIPSLLLAMKISDAFSLPIEEIFKLQKEELE